ncbi:MAG: HAD family phosphatase [Gaiellales bacterium]|nr:HAD family phosphatase [Gaiellales bacterium]
MIRAVVFDLDGVLLDSQQIWDTTVREFIKAQGGRWRPLTVDETLAGGCSRQWAAWLKDRHQLTLSHEQIRADVIAGLLARYRLHLPVMPGAEAAVRRLARDFRLGLASSLPADVIAFTLETMDVARLFSAWASSDDVGIGKPAPDVYLEVCHRLSLPPASCLAVEDSPDGLRSARDAGLRTVSVPPIHASAGALNASLADAVLEGLEQLTTVFIRALG